MRRSTRLAAKTTDGAAPADAEHAEPSSSDDRATVQRHSGTGWGPLPAELLLLVLNTINDPIDRWQTAAGLALAGAFGTAWRIHLEPFWEDEYLNEATVCGIKKTGQLLKAIAANLGHRGLDHLKKTELEALLPKSVHPAIIRAVCVALRHRRVEAALEAAGLGKYKSAHHVREHIRLRKPKVEHVIDCLRRMQELTDALAEHGLDIDLEDRQFMGYIERGEGSVQSILEPILGRKTREEELLHALDAWGLSHMQDLDECFNYIYGGKGNVEDIIQDLRDTYDRYDTSDSDYSF